MQSTDNAEVTRPDDSSQYIDPRSVSEFARYSAFASLQPAPATPPALLPSKTAIRYFINIPIVWFGTIIVSLILSKLALPGLIVIAITWVGFIASIFCMYKTANRNAEEWTAGYTTLTMQLGAFWTLAWSPRIRRLRGRWGSFEWDYSALWILNSDGTVKSPPTDTTKLKPGFYPSPHKTNRLELWSGKEWGEVYRDAPGFF